mgnify:FL=1
MADRYPLIVNAVSKKIEELVSGDNLDLTGNCIIVSGDLGSGKYLKSDGNTVLWDSPGDVYLTTAQTLTNKTLEQSTISGSVNTIQNIPNASLNNSSITINGAAIALGGTVTTPNDNTTYGVSAVDGLNVTSEIIRLTDSGGNTDDITIAVGNPANVPAGSNALALEIERSGDQITIAGTAPDADTITTLASGTGGTPQTGAITIAASGSSTVSQDPATRTITIDSSYVDTITRVRGTSGQVYAAGDFTFLDGNATTVTQGVDGNGDPTITYESTDTVTRLKGGNAGTFTSGDVSILGGTNVTASQAGGVITIASTDTDTVTRIASGTNAVVAGDFKFVATGASSISQNTVGGVTTITITSINSDTGASLTASDGLILDGTNFEIKNASNLSGNTLLKWDSGNSQIANSLITDNGSTVTIGGDLVVDGTQTVLNTSVLVVEDNDISLRKGTNLTGADGGITLNRTTDAAGTVQTYTTLQWYESGAYWRSWDGSVSKRFVTENEVQTLTNKTLTSPTLQSPVLGAATATSINGLTITSVASGTLTIAANKTLDIARDITLTTDNNLAAITANLRQGGDVAFTSDTLASFASTTSTQMRGLVSDTTGTGKLMFNDLPAVQNGISTTSTGFSLINSGATSINFGGAAGAVNIGASSGTTTINHDLVVDKEMTVGTGISDDILLNGTVNVDNADLIIFGTEASGTAHPMRVGRGNAADVHSNVAVGHAALNAATSGSQNIAIGYESQFTTNTGAANTSLGHRALRANGVGADNTAIGRDCLLVNLDGEKNVAIGNNAMETNSTGDANVCIGYYAGYNVKGTGNVLIGPADDANQTNATFEPPNANGNRQLVIGSGTEAWIKGDATYDVTIDKNFRVNQDATIVGNLTVTGTTTTVKSAVMEISDKDIVLAAVVSTQFVCNCTDASANITSISPTLGLIPGMAVSTTTSGITIPAGTTIVSITNNTAVLSNVISGTGTPTIDAVGPSDTSADGGGMVVKGTTDKKLTWKHIDGGVTYDTWVSTEHMDFAANRHISIDNVYVADGNSRTIGPNSGGGVGETNQTWTLGTAVSFTPTTLSVQDLTVTGTLLCNAGNKLTVSGSAAGLGEFSIVRGEHTDTSGPTVTNAAVRIGTYGLKFKNFNGSRHFFFETGNVQIGSVANGSVAPTRNLEIRDDAPIFKMEGSVANAASVIELYHTRANGADKWRSEIETIDGGLSFQTGTAANGAPTEVFQITSGAVLPGSDDSKDLGSSAKRWANVYTADAHFNNVGTGGNEVDGTEGHWTMQEGADSMYLINRITGKKFKIAMTEVS